MITVMLVIKPLRDSMISKNFILHCHFSGYVSVNLGGTRERSWLRPCATSRKVANLIPNDVTGIFHWHNPTGRTMALGLTQRLTEMSTRNISWGYRWPVHRADSLTTFMCWLSWNLGASTSWNPEGLSRSVMGVLYLLSVNLSDTYE